MPAWSIGTSQRGFINSISVKS